MWNQLPEKFHSCMSSETITGHQMELLCVIKSTWKTLQMGIVKHSTMR
jgi:hypothetical protein